MSVHYTVDISDAYDELRRIDDPPGTDVTLRLEAVITAQYQLTQQFVHVITGSLKASGHLHDSEVRDHRWESGFSYGGPAPGYPNSPVDYAEIEQGRAPGGAHFWSQRGWLAGTDSGGRTSVMHDFMAPVGAFEHRYREAIMDFLRGET